MARRIYTSVENESKRVKTIYTPVTAPSTVTIKNLCPTINGSSGFTVGGGTNNKIESSTTHVKYSTNSLKITGDANNPEATAENSTTIALNSQHKYYVRVEVYQEVAGGGVDFYWPIAEPNVFSHSTIGPAEQWNLHSNVIERSSFTNGNYKFRLDLNNNRTTQTAWYDGWMIIDLTDTFGIGHEPDKEWCDTNITFFAGSSTIKRPEDIYIAKPVRRGYIGVGGIARQFFSSEQKLVYYGKATDLSVARSYLAATTVGDYALFGGGYGDGTYCTTVDTYTSNLVKGTATDLSVARNSLAATTVGDYALFAGGYSSGGIKVRVDVYNHNLTHSKAGDISVARREFAATTVGDYALFGGGGVSTTTVYATVDTYTSNLVKGTATDLSTKRRELAATTVGDYALFAGGCGAKESSTRYATVDTYTSNLVKGTATDLSVARSNLAATTVGDYALFGGGYTGSTTKATVDTYTSNLVKGTATNLNMSRRSLEATTVGEYALFGCGITGSGSSATYHPMVETYNSLLVRETATNLSVGRQHLAATTIGNYALFGGGSGADGEISVVDVYQVI